MSLKSSNKIDTNRYELEIEVSGEEFESAVNRVYLRQRKKIAIPGFRKGKVPRKFIEKYYGEKVFYEDAIEDLYPIVVDEAIEEAGLDVIEDKVDFDLIKADKDGLEFKIAVTVKPEVEIEGYKGIEIKVMSTEVTDEDVDKEIESVRERNSRLVTVEDRSAQNGDSVVIDFKGYVDGVPFEGGESENHTLTLGSGQFIPGFEDQIIGHNTDDEFDVIVTFPDDYHAENLAGKESKFEVKLHEIKVRELPELDDEFVKDVSEFDTLDDYKADLRTKILERKESEAEADCENQIMDKLIELMKAEIPEAMFNNKLDYEMKNFEYRLRSQGLTLDLYAQYSGMDKSAIRESFRPSAEKSVKSVLALEKIAQLENIKPNETEIEDAFSEIAKDYKIDVERVKNMISEEDIIKDLSVDKALNFVKDNAVIVD